MLDAVYENGITHWDTADVYGDSEKLMGQWFKRTGKREDIFLATKFGVGRHWGSDFKRGVNGEPDYVPKALQRSLEHLGVDYIDLWYLHRCVVLRTLLAAADSTRSGPTLRCQLSLP